MKNLMTLLTCTILLLVSCKTNDDPCANHSLAESNVEDQEEYLIIESVLSKEFNDPDLVQIAQESLPAAFDSILIAPAINSGQLQFDSMIVADYINLNSSSYRWGEELFTGQQTLISKDELKCHFPDNASDGWPSYYSEYKDSVGFLRFGRPFYNDKEEAVVVYHHACGIWCGSGYVATLKKEEGKWVVTQNIMTWQS